MNNRNGKKGFPAPGASRDNPKGKGKKSKKPEGKPNDTKASGAHGKKGSPPICNFFRNGSCKKGNKCSYSHDVPSGAKNNPPANAKKSTAPATKSQKQAAQSSSHSLKDFCVGLQKSLKSQSNSGFIPNDRNLQQWRVCFESAGFLTSDLAAFRSTFLQTYLKLPDEERFAPKAENLLQVVDAYLKQPRVDLQIILNIFQQRLSRHSSLQTIDDKMKIECGLRDMESTVRDLFRNAEMFDKLVEISTQIKEYKVKISSLVIKSSLKSASSLSPNETTKPMFGWLENSTVGWLASGCIIGGPTLKKHYKSVNDYVLSVQSVWTMLTFYWGTAALWPRCRCKQSQNDMACGKPLLSQHKRNGGHCSMKIQTVNGKMTTCDAPATWKCGFRGHDSICDRCVDKHQELILGPRGSREASTDIYDGEVTRTHLQMDSAVLTISKFMSRKPPTVPVRWRTTYRLQPATLVGVIVMHASNVSLKKDMKIYWGEVSNTYGDLPEFQLRERGNMTVRILSRADCNDLPAHINLPFSVGSKVVVIDLRVFVPEVMSVLSTLVHSSFSNGLERLPFVQPLLACNNNGQKSLWEEVIGIYEKHDPSKLEKIDDIMAKYKGREAYLLDKVKRKYDFTDEQAVSMAAVITAGHGLNEMIKLAVESSQILCIKQLPPVEKAEIITRICKIAPVRSLDETQGIAFALGLLKTLHCTQGPPGTGKSYVGVCLILALIVVREVVKRKNIYVGPIVALSYKNHALDEFLVDVLENNSSLNQRGTLIRLGKPENPKLENFTERRSEDESNARKELERRVIVLKNAKVHVQKWLIESDISSSDSLESVYDCLRVLCFNPDEDPGDNPGEDCFEYVKELFKSIQAFSIDEIVATMMSDSEHWHPSSHECGFNIQNLSRQEVFLKCWLTGLTPPPRCLFGYGEKKQCANSAMDGSSFCEETHTCKFPQCFDQRHSAPNSRFCQVHCCDALEGCTTSSLDGSRYCAAHCCPTCIDHKKVGRYACEIHCCSEPDCDQLQMTPFSFCTLHCCKICIANDAVSNNSMVPPNMSYCELHTCSVAHCVLEKCNDITCVQHSCRVCGTSIEFDDLCIAHRCSHDEESCSMPRVQALNGSESLFCQLHTCVFCVELDCPLTQCTYAPSYTCIDHPRCQEINQDGSECFQLASTDGLICDQHERLKADASTTCAGVTKKRKPCRTPKPNTHQGVWFCLGHIAQAPTLPLSAGAHSKEGKKKVALFAEPDLFPPSEMSVLRQDDAMKLVTCDVSGCEHKKGYVEDIGYPNITWKCMLHSAISRSKRIIETLNQTSARAEVVEMKVHELPPVLPSSAPTRGCGGDVKADYDIILGDEEFDEDPLRAQGIDVDELEDNKDELSVVDSDDEEDEINEANQHLHDILGADEEDDEDCEGFNLDDFKDLDNERRVSSEDLVALYDSCCQWTWAMVLQERQKHVFQLITTVSLWMKQLCQKAEEYIDEARVLRSQASGRVLKAAVIIGGTIVGAANRLAALRAAEPFAIIVEEACEVMEPTLVAVLSVASVQKVQLIGDHRQLPAFVNNCWYDLACSMPTIKTSLFERLVVGDEEGDGNIETCSILAVQRRMRPAISNLTKHHYADVIEIQDHACTLSQKIGNKLTAKQLLVNSPKQALWEGDGRFVPGLSSCVYFWNIAGNEESKNKAGISACNDMEADAIVQLVRFLVLCGISLNAIAVITPYSGQKRLLIDKLRKGNCIPPREKFTNVQSGKQGKAFRGRNNKSANSPDSVLVSTVDRYQGDENDIVILSLVRARGGNRFVGLLNRFIVASSRARLGYYVVGSVTAVETSKGDSHWDEFLDHLKDSAERDEGTEDNPFQGSCCTNDLPICCPQHRSSTKSLAVRKQNMTQLFPQEKTWDTLCLQPCAEPLHCGHSCKHPCHFLTPLAHPSCSEMITRPCDVHKEVRLRCGSVNILENETIEVALSKWKCDLKDNYRRPCDHIISLKCFDYKNICDGVKTMPDCLEKVADYIHPKCNHVIPSPTCCEHTQYQRQPPVCQERVKFKRPCGHTIQMKCFQAIEEHQHPRECQQIIQVKRPRCSHSLSIKCHEFTHLQKQWDRGGHEGIEDNTIEVGAQYGPDERNFLRIEQCFVPVNVRKPCGHVLSMPCCKAFAMVEGEDLPPCMDMSAVMCYICREPMNIPCHLQNAFEEWNPFLAIEDISLLLENNKLIVLEDRALAVPYSSSELWSAWKKAKCATKISMRKRCQDDHVVPSMSCKDILNKVIVKKEVTVCKELTERLLACGHSTPVSCHRKSIQPPPQCRREVNEEITFPSCDHTLKPKTCNELQKIRSGPLLCEKNIIIELYRCGHPVTIPCKNKLLYEVQPWFGNTLDTNEIVQAGVEYCQPCPLEEGKCEKLVSFQKECGHILQDIPCDVAFQMAGSQLEVSVCKDDVLVASPLCHHNITVSCHLRKEVATWQPWPESAAAPTYKEVTVGGVESDIETMKIYFAPIPSPQTLLPFSLAPCQGNLTCDGYTWVQFETCGHTQKVLCSDLYNMDGDHFQSIKCSSFIDHPCSRQCGQPRQILCHEHQTLSVEELDAECPNLMTHLCRKCNINNVHAPCSQQFPECKAMVECVLPCGHAAKPWMCHIDPDPRFGHDASTNLNDNCWHCVKLKWEQTRDLSIELDFLQLMAQKLMLQELESDDTNLLNEISLEPPFDLCEKARDIIISKNIEAMETRGAPMKFPPIVSFPCCIDEYIRSSYDLVFYEIPASKNPKKDGILKRFSQERTIYGHGKHVSLLKKHLVENLASSSGVVKLCIAMAFKCNMLTQTKPFTLDLKQMVANTNKCMQEFRRKGFDCVEVQIEHVGVDRKEEKTDCVERVYWEPGAIVPVSIVEVQLNTSCLICGDFFGRDGKLGALCSEGHFLCYESCFPEYLSSAKEPGAIGRSVQNGYLKCPGGCSSCYRALELGANNCPSHISEELLSFEIDYKVTQSNNIIREEEEKKKKKEIDDLLAMDELDREVRILSHKITEDILTPKCPRCKQAFFDFDGCFALTCSNIQCQAAFCAYCFKDCGGDAHQHVANCKHNSTGGNVFGGNMNTLNKVWKKIRREKIEKLLKENMKTEVKKKLQEKMKKDFKELGVVVA